jgi:ATP/maltotriose-dependent transcriptional regulator MalT
VAAEPDTEVRRQAVQMIQRYGATGRDASQRPGALSGRGVEAGESLLRVAQLAVRHGQLGQALAICGQSAEVFKYFGLSHGLLKAHHYRAKIAFALGDTDLASRCLADVQRVATHVDDGREAARAALMQADVLLSQMLFSQAADLASTLIAKAPYADDPALVARGLAVVAWAHYGRGAYPIAHALCGDLREQAARSGRVGLQVNAELLSALIDARRQRPAAAIRSVCSAIELLTQCQPLSDAQSDLVNVAELAVHLDRCDLAAPLVRSLEAFSEQPNQRLRAWVSDRLRSMQGLPSGGEFAAIDASVITQAGCSDVLRSLVLQ